jgi:hypothetical protein
MRKLDDVIGRYAPNHTSGYQLCVDIMHRLRNILKEKISTLSGVSSRRDLSNTQKATCAILEEVTRQLSLFCQEHENADALNSSALEAILSLVDPTYVSDESAKSNEECSASSTSNKRAREDDDEEIDVLSSESDDKPKNAVPFKKRKLQNAQK